MPESHVELVGGPLDGHRIPRKSGKYAWVSGKLARGQEADAVHDGSARIGGGAGTSPKNGRALYATDGMYAGHRTSFCNACGTYHQRVEGGRERLACPLGGADSER